MKNTDLYELRDGLTAIKNVHSSTEFAYAAAKNIRILNTEIQIIEDMFKPSEEYKKEYEKAYQNLILKYCKKNEEGEPEVTNRNGQILYRFEKKFRDKFDIEVEKLKKKMEKVVTAREKQLEDREKFLQEETKVKIFKVDKKHAPKDLTLEQFSSIMAMIK